MAPRSRPLPHVPKFGDFDDKVENGGESYSIVFEAAKKARSANLGRQHVENNQCHDSAVMSFSGIGQTSRVAEEAPGWSEEMNEVVQPSSCLPYGYTSSATTWLSSAMPTEVNREAFRQAQRDKVGALQHELATTMKGEPPSSAHTVDSLVFGNKKQEAADARRVLWMNHLVPTHPEHDVASQTTPSPASGKSYDFVTNGDSWSSGCSLYATATPPGRRQPIPEGSFSRHWLAFSAWV